MTSKYLRANYLLPGTIRPTLLWGNHRHGTCYSTHSSSNDSNVSVPQTVDLLQAYRGLVALGRIQYEEEQVRVIMQLRKLQRELTDYAPPALMSHYMNTVTTGANNSNQNNKPWWLRDSQSEDVSVEMKALVRVKTHAEDLAGLTTPKGFLLTGTPGSGKSFIVDLWFNSLATPYKARKHYSELVLEIYRGVWEETQRRMKTAHQTTPDVPAWDTAIRDRWRDLLAVASLPSKWASSRSVTFSSAGSATHPTIAFVVAQRLILKHWLIVFDEVQLLDVSSATLLADVLSWFWRMGGVLVGTSNKVPDDLYKNGVQRERLEPFVEALKARCPVIIMQAERDWREVRAGDRSGRTWYTFDQEAEFGRKLATLTGSLAAGKVSPRILTVFGRTLHVPWTQGPMCKFSFSELCEQSLGPADYLTIASAFSTVIITSIPILNLSSKNEARRFISLIDALYEARCRVICLAASEPELLFFPEASSSSVSEDPAGAHDNIDVMMAETVGETRDLYRPNISSYDAPNMAEAPPVPHYSAPLETLSIFSGKDEQFAFKRALSRLLEMTSESYGLEASWTPLPASVRKWEFIPNSAKAQTPTPAAAAARPDSRPAQSPTSDSTEEASYEGRLPLDRSRQPEAPRLGEDHVWGVREDWGKRAGNWGRGVKAYEDKPHS